MNVKAIAFGAVLGFLVAVAPSCGTAKCSSANCKTCCDSAGVCVKDGTQNNNTTCGTAGNACTNCTTNNTTCNAGACGAAVVDAGPGPCDGCLANGKVCVTLANTSVINCGINGVSCIGCPTGSMCTNGACSAVDAGAPKGRLGDACATDAECNKLPTASGYPKYCKKTSMPLTGTIYKDGYCTEACDTDADCSTPTVPGYCWSNGLPFLGDNEIICTRIESTDSNCRPGYKAEALDNAGTEFVCLPAYADGSLAIPDAGPANPGAAGSACTSNGQCGPSTPPFSCSMETLAADGGFATNPGGMCTGDCSLVLFESNSNFCGTNGICSFDYFKTTPKSFALYWAGAEQGMNSTDGGTATNTCRSGYRCDPQYSDGRGACKPDCRVATNTCAAIPDGYSHVCDNATGACEFDCRKYSTLCSAPKTCDTTSGLCK